MPLNNTELQTAIDHTLNQLREGGLPDEVPFTLRRHMHKLLAEQEQRTRGPAAPMVVTAKIGPLSSPFFGHADEANRSADSAPA